MEWYGLQIQNIKKHIKAIQNMIGPRLKKH